MSDIGLVVSLLAALGIGTVIAAIISRWNAISQLRQNWVDELRQEIAQFFHAVERVGEAFGDVNVRQELRQRRDHAMFVYRQILLRLNLREPDHRRLDRRLVALLTTGVAADAASVDYALAAARQVLKREWDRTKYGPMTGAFRQFKRFSHRRWVRKQRRKTLQSRKRRSLTG